MVSVDKTMSIAARGRPNSGRGQLGEENAMKVTQSRHLIATL